MSMRMRGWNRYVAAAMVTGCAGCAFEVDFGAGRFHCQSSADCPAGQGCADGYCELPSGGSGGPDASPGVAAAADASPASQILTFFPVADTYVDAGDPAGNHGSSDELRVDGTPVVSSYILFDTGELEDIEERVQIESAALELYAKSQQSVGYRVFTVSGPVWSESELTFQNAPSPGALVGSSGPVAAGTWTSVDLPAVFAEGDFQHFALTCEDETALSLASREAGELSPRLVITAAAQ